MAFAGVALLSLALLGWSLPRDEGRLRCLHGAAVQDGKGPQPAAEVR